MTDNNHAGKERDQHMGDGQSQGNLLVALASKGNDTVRLVLLVLVLWNGWGTRQAINKSSQEAFREIKVIYKNQKVIASYWEHATMEHDLLLKKFNIPQPSDKPGTLSNLPEFDKDGDEERNQ